MNPSFPHRTSVESMLRMRANIPDDDSWNREARGIWPAVAVHKALVSVQRWREMFDVGPADGAAPAALGVDMSHGRDISIVGCWLEGEQAHMEQVWAGSDPNLARDWLVERAGRRIPVVIDAASPAGSLAPELKARRTRVVVTSAANMAQACGLFEDRIAADTLTHAAQPALTDAVMSARRRPIRDAGGWGLDRRDPASQIHPIVAAVLSLFGATQTFRPDGGIKRLRKAVIG